MTGALLVAKLCLLGVLATFVPLFVGVSRGRRALAILLLAALAALTAATVAAVEGGRIAHALGGHWPVALAALAGGALALALLAWLAYRFPRWFVPFMLVILPLRVTLTVSGDTVRLLIPPYLVAGAGLIAEVVLRDRLRPALPGRRDPVRLALATVIAVAGVSALWAGYGYAGLDHAFLTALVKLLAFYLPFAVVFDLVVRYTRTGEDLRRLLVTLVCSAVAMALLGIVEYAGHFVIFDRAGIARTEALGQAFRVNSLFWDPNMFSRFLVVGLLICATLAVVAPGWRRWLAAGALVMAAANVFTLSRSGWVGLGAGLILFVYVWLGRRKGTLVTAGLVVLFGALLGTLVVVRKTPLTHPHVFDHPWGINRLTGGRYYLATAGLQMFADRPLAGVGIGGFPLAYPSYQDRHSIPDLIESHTTPLTVIAEEGVLGALAYIALLVAYFATALRSDLRRRSAPPAPGSAEPRAGPPALTAGTSGSQDEERRLRLVQAGIAGAVLATIVHSLLYNAWFEDPYVWVLLALSTAATSSVTAWPAGRRPAGPGD